LTIRIRYCTNTDLDNGNTPLTRSEASAYERASGKAAPGDDPDQSNSSSFSCPPVPDSNQYLATTDSQ
jgi:hypothetical protein